jgi:general secretion pathway protein F
MANFRYEAMNADGRVIRGKMTGENERDIQRQLKTQSMMPLTIDEVENAAARGIFFKKKLKTQDYIFVLEQLAVLLKAGVPLVDSVESIANSGVHPDLADAFALIAKALKRGEKFSVALKTHLTTLPDYVYQLVGAGELTGDIDVGLRDSAKQMEYDYQVAQEVKGALTYPIILVTVGIAAVVFIFVVVVPKFEDLFMTNFEKLPGLAQFVMSSGIFIRENIYIIGGVLIAGIVTSVVLMRQQNVKIAMREFSQKIPLFGEWMKESETGKWATMMSVLLKNKIALMQALELSRSTLKIESVKQQMTEVAKAVRGGSTLADALSDYTNFATISINLVRVGERAGNLAEMLDSLSGLYAREGKERMQRFMALVQPLAIIIVGGAIGMIVGGIIQGIASLTDIAT